MRLTFSNPVGKRPASPRSRLNRLAGQHALRDVATGPPTGSVRPSPLTPPRASAERGARARLLPTLVLLAVLLVLWVGPAAAQTVTISPTGSRNVTEGDAATAFSVTVEDLPQDTTAQFGLLVIEKSGGVTTGDFKLYDSDPSMGTPTALTLLDAPNSSLPQIYHRLWFAVGDIPSTKTTYNYWIEVPDDSVILEGEESIKITFAVLGPHPAFAVLTQSETLTLSVTDAALPDPTGKPTTPTNLMTTEGKGAVTLAWDAIDTTSGNTNRLNDGQITKHQVRQSTDGDISDETWTDIPNSGYGGVNAASHTIESLTDGTQYTFQVRAVNGCTTSTGCGNSDPSAAVMATPLAAALAQPTGLTATAGNTEITLTWTDPGDATIFYYEYRQKAGSAAFGPWTEIPDSTATTTSYRSTGLHNGTAYSYRIRARTSVKPSPASDAVTATPRGMPPAAPVLTATPRNGGVTLSWPNPVDASILRYEYQYRIGNEVYQPWETAPTPDTSGATLQIPVGGLANGTAHTFRIRVVNADGTTTSNEATAAPVAAVPAKPTGLTTWWADTQGLRDRRVLEWDEAADPSILRYEYTTDEGRTWSLLAPGARATRGDLPEDQFRSGYTIRIRAVNAAGPGPASEPAVEEETEDILTTAVYVGDLLVEYDATTKKATLVWKHLTGARYARLRWWALRFSGSSSWNTVLPIGTIRYEIPAQFNGGETISLWIVGCVVQEPCIEAERLAPLRNYRMDRVVGAPESPPGFPPPRATRRSRWPGTIRWTAASPSTSMSWVPGPWTFPTATTRAPTPGTKPAIPSRVWTTGAATPSRFAP